MASYYCSDTASIDFLNEMRKDLNDLKLKDRYQMSAFNRVEEEMRNNPVEEREEREEAEEVPPITPPMRTKVLEWMLEVCQEKECERFIFPLATHLLDRMLFSWDHITQDNLQAYGAVCLSVAAKLRPTVSFTFAELSMYTADSVSVKTLNTLADMTHALLGFDLNYVTAADFIEVVVGKLGADDTLKEKVLKLAHVFLTCAYLYMNCKSQSASQLATACIINALNEAVVSPALHQKVYDLMELDPAQEAVENTTQSVFSIIKTKTDGIIFKIYRDETLSELEILLKSVHITNFISDTVMNQHVL